jgi:hypothetical protein
MSAFRGEGRGVSRFVRGARGAIALGIAGVLGGALGTGCGSNEGLVGGSCADGYTQCGDRCVPLAMDPDNCGACGQACLLGVACVDGVCGGSADASHASHDGGGDASLDGASADGASADAMSTDGEASEANAEPGDGSGNEGAEGAAGSDGGDATLPVESGAPDGGAPPEGSAGGDATFEAGGDATLGGDATADATATADGATETDGATAPEGASETDAGGEDATVGGEDGSPDAETGEAASCDESLSLCGGGCVDTTSDPSNCGGCGNVCASQFCQDAQCLGTTSGGLIFIGHDYDETSTGKVQSSVLSNAVFIPQANPLRVLEYDRYVPAQAVTQIASILGAVATSLGRTLQIHPTSTDADIPASLSLQNYDVLLVPDQSTAPAGALAMLGPSSGGNWAPALASFAQGGGVVVVLDGGTGTGEMPQFLTNAGLLDVTAQTALAARTEIDDIARGDVESVGLVTPYLSSGNTVSLTTEPNGQNVVYVLVTGGDAGGGAPVVIHKIF